MRILHTVEFYRPSRGGSQEVVRQISEGLARRGHAVTVATSRSEEPREPRLDGVTIEAFAVRGNAVTGCRGETRRYRQWLLDERFDVMLNYGAQQWASDCVFPLLDRLDCAKVLAPCGLSMLHARRWHEYFSGLPAVLGRYDRLVFHGRRHCDYGFARQHGLDHLTVIPNGASRAEFEKAPEDFRARHAIPEDVPLLLTVGSHTGRKGHAATLEAFRRARIGRAALVVVGNVVGEDGCLDDCRRRARRTRWRSLGRKRVLLLDPPREEVLAAFRAADLFVFPSQLECSPVVLFEALASRTPFLTTAAGNAEEIVEWTGGGVLTAARPRRAGTLQPDVADLAGWIERLVEDAALRQQLADRGHAAWLREFTWETITERYEALYTGLLEARA